jgi:hypothetical protein
MDSEKSHAHKLSSEQQRPVSVPLGEPILGSWTIEKNFPYGFVIRNSDPMSGAVEYHFWFDSNGWFTAKCNGKVSGVFNAYGQRNTTPHLCDKESTKKQERIQDLREKGLSITPEEARELLLLSGLIKEEK